ncbi:DUF3329 domain-containing protein [Bradyrhizobium sp. 27S5]|uniref:DUF3329 domain-containing protein n=1 Tax=Bradyrhizobium sp. 27S5 TaxID=3139728 RepID=UPI0030CAB1D9
MDNSEHPFLNPPWRRVVLVALCALWMATGFWADSPGWGTIALAFTGYAFWRFLYTYDSSKTGNDTDRSAIGAGDV